MSTHNILLSIEKKKITQIIPNYPNLRSSDFFLGIQERVRNSHGKQAISVRAMKCHCIYFSLQRH